MSVINVRKITGIVLQILVITLGEVINVLTFRALIIPAKLLSGGVVGAALLLNQLLALPIGLQTIIYNIPIFLLGYRYLGRKFILLSMVGVGVFSVLLDNITLPTVTHDLLLIAVFGGLATGIADGIIIRAGGSTGGFDILGLIVSRRFGISTGQVFLAFNGIIIALAAVFSGNLDLALYTMIMLFVSTRVINAFLSTSARPVALIISNKHQEIADRVLTELSRGVTYLQGGGAYTEVEIRVLLCVLTRYELIDLRRIVHEVDLAAFMIILDASDVIGRFDSSSPLQRFFG